MAGKKEARIERQNAKRLADQKASDKLRLAMAPVAEKKPRAGANPASIFEMMMTWTEANADRQGAWPWGQEREWGEAVWNEAIHPKLKDWEKLKWQEIDIFSTRNGHKMHHSMDVDEICEDAQLRLMELGHSGESIFRFRMGGKPRLWGFRIVADFQILWFDPEHKIYPVDKD